MTDPHERTTDSRTMAPKDCASAPPATPSSSKSVPPGYSDPPLSVLQLVIRRLWGPARWRRWLVFAVLISSVAVPLAWQLVPPRLATGSLDKLLSMTGIGFATYPNVAFEIATRTTVVDFSLWRRVPQRVMRRESRYAPVIYNNSFQLKRLGGDGGRFLKNHWTRGMTIDFASPTHEWRTRTVRGNYQPGEIRYNKHEILFDVADEPLGENFTLQYQAIYWNSFQQDTMESVGAVITYPVHQLVLVIVLPFEPNCLQLQFRTAARDNSANHSAVQNPACRMDGDAAAWTIDQPRLETVYSIHWTWPKAYRQGT